MTFYNDIKFFVKNLFLQNVFNFKIKEISVERKKNKCLFFNVLDSHEFKKKF